jgi:hypothetical protein
MERITADTLPGGYRSLILIWAARIATFFCSLTISPDTSSIMCRETSKLSILHPTSHHTSNRLMLALSGASKLGTDGLSVSVQLNSTMQMSQTSTKSIS